MRHSGLRFQSDAAVRRVIQAFHRNLAPCPNRWLLRGACAYAWDVPRRLSCLLSYPPSGSRKSPGERRQGFFSGATPISAPNLPTSPLAETTARQLTPLSPTRERARQNRSPARPVVKATPNRSATTSRETVMKPAKTTTGVLAGLAAALAAGVASSASQAATIAALQDGKAIVWIDTTRKSLAWRRSTAARP